MSQINSRVKCVFTIFNIFFASVGGILILLAALAQALNSAHGGEHGGESYGHLTYRNIGVIVVYATGIVTILIAILGAYGAHKEKKVALIIFLVCMVIGLLLWLTLMLFTLGQRPVLEGQLKMTFWSTLPLDQASDSMKMVTEKMQTELHCCGLFNYTDWENIPSSCLCNQQLEPENCQVITYAGFMQQRTSVYMKPCFPIILRSVLLQADVIIGVTFFLAVLVLVGIILCSIVIHQMRYPNSPPAALMPVPTFTAQPPKYEELHNLPSY